MKISTNMEDKLMENKVYCKVEPKKGTAIFKVLIAFMILLTVLLIVWFIPQIEHRPYKGYVIIGNYKEAHIYDYYIYKNLFGVTIGETYGKGFSMTHYNLGTPDVFVPIIIWFVIFILFITLLIIKHNAKKCSLELNQDGILGQKKKLFSKESLNMPYEKIDSVYLRNSIIDKIISGQTIVINSASSRVKFLCIANAQEFVDKTLEELKKYKESVAAAKEKAPASSESDAMDALLKLKSLLDQGLISQEEFEEKRRSLAEKI